MAEGYGTLRGRLDRWVREDADASPHLQIRVLDDTSQAWRIAVNVQSDTGSEVVYWLVDPLLGHPILTGLADLPTGFNAATPSSAGALDYVRAPLFDWQAGTALPASGGASSDDLQDLLALHLQQCQSAGGEVFAFGMRFDSNLHKPIDIEFGNTDGLHVHGDPPRLAGVVEDPDLQVWRGVGVLANPPVESRAQRAVSLGHFRPPP
jgi:uncharacterized protein YukJ